MQDNPFGHLLPQQTPAAQPVPQSAPRPNTRVISAVPPSERRAEEDQRLQRERDARAADVEAERLRLAQQGEQRQEQQFGQGNVSEQQAAFLLDRVGGGIDDLNFVIKNMPGGKGAPSAVDAVLYNSFGPNSIVTRGMTESGRKAVEDVQLDILDALLTLGTGAAYNAEQLQGQRAAYFPQFNDDEQTVALKRRRLERLFNNAKVRAGPLGERLDQYRGQFLGASEQQPNQATLKDENPYGARLAMDGSGDDPFDRARYLQERFGIDPGSETRLVGMLNANIGNPNLSPDMVLQIYRDAGVPPPSDQDLQQLVKEFREGGRAPATGIDTSAAEKAYVQGLDTIIDRAGFNPEDQSATLANTARQGAAFEGFDEITGVVNAVAEGLQGNNPIEGYRTGRDVTRRMIELGDAANPITGVVGRVVGSLPTGVVGSAGRVNSLGNAARIGAVEGGIIGFNQGEGAGGSALGAAVGAPAGAILGLGFQAGGNKIQNALASRRPQVDPAQVQSVVDAGARRGVTVRRPDVDPNVRNQRAAVQQTEQGRSAIAAADSNDLGQIEAALIRDLGGQAGTTRTETAFGIQQGVKAVRDNLRNKAQVEYRAAAAQAGNVTAPPTNAVALIDQQIAELTANGANTNAGRIKYLQDLKADMTQGGGLSVNGLRALRTDLRKNLENSGIYTNDFERRLGLVLDEAGKDVEAALQPFPQALARYQQGDKLWQQQAKFGQQVGDLLLGRDGNLGPGQAADRLMTWAKKDPARLARLMSEADTGTQDEVRALVASQLGRSSNGNFSLAALLTQTSPGRGGALSPKAIRTLFGPQGAKAIEDLRILAQAKTDAAAATNRSNTGSLVQKSKAGLRRLVLGGFGFAAAADAGGGMGLATLAAGGATVGGEIVDRLGRERAIRLLLDPDFTGWLRRLPNTNNPQAINRSFAGLRSIASRSPVMMTDVQALERALIEAANDNATRLAAEPSNASEER